MVMLFKSCSKYISLHPEVRFLIHIRPRPEGCRDRRDFQGKQWNTFSQTLQRAKKNCIHVNLLLYHTKILITQLVWSEAFWH